MAPRRGSLTVTYWKRLGRVCRLPPRELFYLSGLRLMAASVRMGAGFVEADSARALFSVPVVDATFYTYDVTADGTRFVVLKTDESNEAGFPTVLSNWQADAVP